MRSHRPPQELMAPFLKRLYAQNEHVIKLGLDAMRQALREGLAPRWPLILVGGSNGKGQVSATLAAFLQSQGLKVGLFTSPHLIDYRERIRVNGRSISQEALLRHGVSILSRFGGAPLDEMLAKFAENEGLNTEVSETALSFFELTLAIAQSYYLEEQIDCAVYEIGLGGRLDACNALDPALSIITSISVDHVQWLGDTLDGIALEKAAIMRPDQPTVIGRDAVDDLRIHAQRLACRPVVALDEEFGWRQINDESASWNIWHHAYEQPTSITLEAAPFQRDNASVAFAAMHQLCEHVDFAKALRGATRADFVKAIETTQWPGRFWRLPPPYNIEWESKADILMDAAHNDAGAQALVASLRKQVRGPISFVLAMSADKDVEAIAQHYAEHYAHAPYFLVSLVDNPRVMSAEALRERWPFKQALSAPSLDAALRGAAQAAGNDGCIVITGSIYLLGACLARLKGADYVLDV